MCGPGLIEGLADLFYKGSASQYFKLAFPMVSGTPVQLCRWSVKTAGDLLDEVSVAGF